MTLWYLPIEPYEERYTSMLDAKVVKELERRGHDYTVVVGDTINDGVETGLVLDAEGRNYYCAGQIRQLMKAIKGGIFKERDVIFTPDFWHSGIESIPYVAAIRNWEIPMYGIICAGSFEEWDFVNTSGMTPWARHIERGWLEAYTGLFVYDEKMRRRILPLVSNPSKVHVSGLVFDSNWVRETLGPNTTGEPPCDVVVFPHRWDTEKDPTFFLQVAKAMPDVEFIITTGRKGRLGTGPPEASFPENVNVVRNKGKKEYYSVLKRSKVVFSSAFQDTVGNAMCEAITLGCMPVVPGGQYEHIPQEYHYKRGDLHGAVSLIYRCLNEYQPQEQLVSWYDKSLDRILDVIEMENNL